MAKDTTPRTQREERRLKEVGLRVRMIREKKGFTLEEVEEKGYPSWRHLQAIEHGKKNFTITSLFRLAKALGVSPGDFIVGLK
jgi:transcriptional regulator with XRE-family HTH domain